MNKLLIVAFMFFTLGTEAQTLELFGIYQGRDLYVKNPQADIGVGYCIYEVRVNGALTTDEINSSAFAVDMSLFGLKKGSPVEILIKHKEDCSPKIINPEVLLAKSTFNVESMSLSPEGKLVWQTSGEAGSLTFAIEQFKWNKWVEVAHAPGKGKPGRQNYTADVPLISGENIFRIKQKDYDGVRYSDQVKVMSSTPAVALISSRVSDKIELTAKAQYELYSEYGELVSKGKATTIDVSELASGRYFLNFGTTLAETIVIK